MGMAWLTKGVTCYMLGLGYNPRVCADLLEGDESISIGCEQLIVPPDAEPNLSFLTISSWLSSLVCTIIVGHNNNILDQKVLIQHQVTANKSNFKAVTWIAVATTSSQVRLFELGSFSCEEVLDGHSATLLCVNVSPCSLYLVAKVQVEGHGPHLSIGIYPVTAELDEQASANKVRLLSMHFQALIFTRRWDIQ
jgi:hypothetical protein